MARYRNVMFTIATPEGLIEFLPDKMEYIVYQEEISESGLYHFQGYCEFADQVSLAQAKQYLGDRTAHIERRMGSQAQAIAYCTKESTRVAASEPYSEGTPRTQGKRTDIEGFKGAVMRGDRLRDLLDDHWGVIARYPKFYQTLTFLRRPIRTVDLKVHLLIGPTGTGKTRFVEELYGNTQDFYVGALNNGTMWFDGYDGQGTVLLDDFSGAASHFPLCSLLRLLDRYPILVPTKGGHTWWMPDAVFVTTNILPSLWYKWENRGEQYKALARRFHKVSEYFVSLPGADSSIIDQDPIWWEQNKPDEALY